MKRFMRLLREAGGMDVVRQYWRAHVLLYAFFQILCQGFSRKSLEIARLSVNNRILKKLRRKYHGFIKEYMGREKEREGLPMEKSRKVWVCWLQGMENAPLLVQKCFQSLKDNLKDREIILLTEKNYRQYVTFPEYICEKIDNGSISKTHMSDLLRLELLITYGGTWVDATVFLSSDRIPDYFLDSELFTFQDLKPGLDGHSTRISSWFMTACTNQPILLLTRALLYEYWKKHKVLQDYYLIHDMFELAIEAYPESWKRVVPFSNAVPHILLLRLYEPYDEKIWQAVRQMCPLHKLSYKASVDRQALQGTYYRKLFQEDTFS